MAIAFDTLEYARRLKQAGFSDAQAEGQTQALLVAMSEGLATRQDVAALGQEIAQLRQEIAQVRQEMGTLAQELRQEMGTLAQELRHEMAAMEARLRQDMASLETRMTIRLGGIMVAGIAVVSALVKLL